MNNDLISREQVLHEIGQLSLDWEYGQGVKDCYNIVENVPTVNPSLNLDNITNEEIEKFKIIWQRAHSKGLLAINDERPQGEWEDVMFADNGIGIGKCNQCGIHRMIDKFCPNCGADMRGGAE